MDGYQRRHNNYNNNNLRERENSNPSFSSTLLDAIYRSIDEGEEQLALYRETMRKKHTGSSCCTVKGGRGEEGMASFQRACMIEKWIEDKKVSNEKVVLRRNSVAEEVNANSRYHHHQLFHNWSSSSSDSSCCGGGFSSSEAESLPARSSVHNLHCPKPIRTQISAPPQTQPQPQPRKLNMNNGYGSGYGYGDYMLQQQQQQNFQNPKQNHEGSFMKTKSKALKKMYGDLKKIKQQPMSPGGKLTNFLNSLFSGSSTGNAKKAKLASQSNASYDDSNIERTPKSAQAPSTCSSASSFSRSCLSKTPSSRGKLSNNIKRSVRFSPVSVILDEDSQPCGHKSLFGDHQQSLSIRNSITEELKIHVMEKNRRVEEAARDLLKNYQKKKKEEFVYEFDQDDAESCDSSDLFELDNLSSIGIERYCEELPVYETTRLATNRPIANALFM